MGQIDCIYVAASTHDARYTRTCVASIRYFYPKIPIRLPVGGRLQRGLADQLKQCWSVEVADLPAGDSGCAFVKLEPLFGRPRRKIPRARLRYSTCGRFYRLGAGAWAS